MSVLERVAENDRAAECKAAKAVGIPLADIRRRAQRLWGHSLPEERDKRAEAGSAQSRGHLTRHLYAELRGEQPVGVGECLGCRRPLPRGHAFFCANECIELWEVDHGRAEGKA